MINRPIKCVFLIVASVVLPAFAIADQGTWTSIDGEKLYSTFCASCHGIDGTPPAAIEHSLSPRPLPLTAPVLHNVRSENELRQVIRDGLGTSMLGFSGVLADEQVAAIARYITTLRKRSGGHSWPEN